jgi:hypothetical protein
MKLNRLGVGIFSLAAACAVSATTWGAETSSFSLTEGIPADVTMVTCTRDHQGLAFVNEQWERVWDRLERARLDRDFKSFMRRSVQQQGGSLEEFEQSWMEISDILSTVDWAELNGREGAFALRLNMPPEVLILLKPTEGEVDESYEQLSELLMKLREMQQQNPMAAPLPVTLERSGDVLVVGLGMGGIASESVALLGGQGTSIAKDPRFQAAFKQLPKAEDRLTWLDVRSLFQQLRQLGQMAAGMAGGPQADQAVAFNEALIDGFGFIDYVASAAATQDKRTKMQTHVKLTEDAKSARFYDTVYGNEPLDKPTRYVPQGAQNVSATTGVDLRLAYQEILKLVEQFAPDGEQQVAMMKQMTQFPLGGEQFMLEEDVLATLSGRMRYFTMQGEGRFSPTSMVLLMEIRDGQEDTARKLLQAIADEAGPMLQAQQAGMVVEEQIAGETFHSFQIQMLAMMMSAMPTVGVADGHLIVASGREAVEAALAAESGATFVDSARFKKEGLSLDGKVLAMNFTDLRGFGDQWASALSFIPLGAAMAGMQGSGDPTTQFLFRILGKLGPVARELNFFDSSCAVTTHAGDRIVIEKVTHYRAPQPPAAGQQVEKGAPAP